MVTGVSIERGLSVERVSLVRVVSRSSAGLALFEQLWRSLCRYVAWEELATERARRALLVQQTLGCREEAKLARTVCSRPRRLPEELGCRGAQGKQVPCQTASDNSSGDAYYVGTFSVY